MKELESQEVWAIVPTRSGSTGLSKKNILPFAGKPLLHYILEAAKGTRLLTRVILTADDDQTIEVASQIKSIEVLKYNPELSRSEQPSFGVFQHTLQKLLERGDDQPEVIVLLRATTPLCLSSDIDNAVSLLLSNKSVATAVVSVTKSDVHPKRVYIIDKNNVLHAREETPEINFPLPRQMFDNVYIRNGAVYATFPEIVLQGSLWGEKPLAYIMPKERSVNINDEIDIILAEELLKRR